jgi:hypothetical protein
MQGHISMSNKKLSRLEVMTKANKKRLITSQVSEYLALRYLLESGA